MSERVGSDIERLLVLNDNSYDMSHISIVSKPIEDDSILIQSRSMSDPTLSDMDFKNKVA